MRRVTVTVLDFFRNRSLEIVQVVLCPLYFWLSFMVNSRLIEPFPGWVVIFLASWVVMTTYIIAWLLYWWKTPDRMTRFGAVAGFYVVFALITYFLSYVIFPGQGIYLYKQSRPFRLDEFMLNMAQLYVTFFLAAVGLISLYRARDHFRRERQLKKEVQRYALQFAMAQISPHSIYNAFNDLYVILKREKSDLAPVLLNIIDVMRYNTKHAGKYDGFVPLQEEMEQVSLLKKLYEFRFKDSLFLDIIVLLNLREFEVIPILVSTLLENAMHYGDSQDPDQPIKLWLANTSTELIISCRNKIRKTARTERSTGIGQPNLRDRLRLVYGPEASLEITNDGVYYEATIRIPLGKAKISHKHNKPWNNENEPF